MHQTIKYPMSEPFFTHGGRELEKWRMAEWQNGEVALANLYGFNSDIDIEAY
jgi:hypothetical protein